MMKPYMKKHLVKITWLLLVLSMTLTVFTPLMTVNVYASNISTSTYIGVVRLTNNSSTTAYNVSVPLTLNTSSYIANGYVWSNLTNSCMRNDAGNDTAYNPAVVSNTTWMFFAPVVPANGSIDYSLYMGGQSNLGSALAYFPGTNGMTTTTDLMLGNNFTFTQVAGVNASAGVNKNLFNKAKGVVCNVTGDNILNLTVYPARQQGTANSMVWLSAGDPYNRLAQNITNFPACNVSGVKFLLQKSGSPTGVAYVRVRDSATDTIVCNFSTLNVATLTTTPTWTYFSISGSGNISTTSNLRISFEYAGGSGSNDVGVGIVTSSVISNEAYSYYNGATWADIADGWDAAYEVAFTPVSTSAPIGSVENTITATKNATTVVLTVNGVSGIATIPNSSFCNVVSNGTAGSWVFGSNNSLYYLRSQVATSEGIVTQNITWQNSAIFTDTSGYGNNATPTFRTTSSNPNVSAVLLSFDAKNQAVVAGWSITDYQSYIGDVPTEPGGATGMYEETNPTFPGASAVNEASDAGGVPRSVAWFIVPLVLLLPISILLFDKTKSLAFKFGVLWICLLFLGLAHIWPLWCLIPFTLLGLTILMSSKIYSY